MYLLKLNREISVLCCNNHLHSTMYLLKLLAYTLVLLLSRFTFHYVSIKTLNINKQQYPKQKFTFHYVSIKTIPRPESTM